MSYLNVALHILVIWILASITPGANVILTMNTALKFNRRLASWSAFGVSTAVMLWGFMGASSLLIILDKLPWLFTTLKILGGTYLLCLGIKRIIQTRVPDGQSWEIAGETLHTPGWQMFRTSFLTSMLNPKTGLFVVSLFTVAMPETITWELTLLVMVIMSSVTLTWHLFLAFVFSRQSAQRVYKKASSTIDYITGGLFTLFGIKVLAS